MLKVIVGGMFAGKSTEVQRQGKRYEIAKKRVLYIKPTLDLRYSKNEIVTHDGQKVNAIRVEADQVVVTLKDYVNDYDVFAFDEIQFFYSSVIGMIQTLLLKDKVVICGGLDLDYTGKPFNITAQLLAMADDVTKLHAVCSSCGNDAYISARKTNNKQRIVVGNEYTPLCRKCFKDHPNKC
ncbi:MAG TPA: thymidine kinase [Pseudoneobacillus sp.]|nr:thymidine kinase [Pseudoneobacillus sp.]